MSDSGNSSMNGSEHSGNSPGAGSRYSGAYGRRYSSKSYYRGGGSKYGNYKDNSYPSYHYRGGGGGDYYYGPSRYYSSRGGGSSHNNHWYTNDYNGYNYGNRRSHDDNRRFTPNPNGRYYNGRYSEPWGAFPEHSVPPSQYSGPYGSGNNTPVDHYRRHHSTAAAAPINSSSMNGVSTSSGGPITPSNKQHGSNTPSSFPSPHYGMSAPAATSTVKRRVDKDESPFYYLTDLDKSSDDPRELESIRQVFKESDRLDKQLEEHNLNLFKSELELGLLATQCEKDKLSVQLTQEKLDTFLMQS